MAPVFEAEDTYLEIISRWTSALFSNSKVDKRIYQPINDIQLTDIEVGKESMSFAASIGTSDLQQQEGSCSCGKGNCRCGDACQCGTTVSSRRDSYLTTK
jgi:hypothetical protein